MLGNRAVQFLSGIGSSLTFDLHQFDASIGSLTGIAFTYFYKTGTSRLFTRTATAFAGEMNVQGGGAVRFDNSAGVADRFGSTATLTFSDGDFEFISHATTPTNETIGTLNSTSYTNRLTVTSPGSDRERCEWSHRLVPGECGRL